MKGEKFFVLAESCFSVRGFVVIASLTNWFQGPASDCTRRGGQWFEGVCLNFSFTQLNNQWGFERLRNHFCILQNGVKEDSTIFHVYGSLPMRSKHTGHLTLQYHDRKNKNTPYFTASSQLRGPVFLFLLYSWVICLFGLFCIETGTSTISKLRRMPYGTHK